MSDKWNDRIANLILFGGGALLLVWWLNGIDVVGVEELAWTIAGLVMAAGTMVNSATSNMQIKINELHERIVELELESKQK